MTQTAETADTIRERISCPRLPTDIRFALVRRPDRSLHKPARYESLTDLARAIHRDRADAGIELRDAPLQTALKAEPLPGVNVYALGEDGMPCRYLGWAYLAGGGRQALQHALFALRPCPAVH